MTNAEKARKIDKAVKLLSSAASAYRHGGGPTAADKFDDALDILELITFAA
ncbi:hypothetical protein LCGC14_1818420 [marine sediment metagenome]|uniref:Uncharacterized protein n=1 Tax=marine sediment metagenome TaxID=412755 RepID=A0A0F9GJR1_9ZZZZ